jgi:hypothetical protein
MNRLQLGPLGGGVGLQLAQAPLGAGEARAGGADLRLLGRHDAAQVLGAIGLGVDATRQALPARAGRTENGTDDRDGRGESTEEDEASKGHARGGPRR